MDGRTFAIGDVHGCHQALTTLLKSLALVEKDSVVFLGDVIDRGPSSKQVIDEIIQLQEVCRVVTIMGNHEEMMRDAISGHSRSFWLGEGGKQTLRSYGCSIEEIPSDHIRWLLSTVPFLETDSEIFVHASLEPDVSLRNQTKDFLRWKFLSGSERPHSSGKRIICGHSSQRDGVPLVLKGWVCLDTCVHGGKWLSCLDVGSDHVYQASETGQTREFPLSKYA